jgi:hypothetical protein
VIVVKQRLRFQHLHLLTLTHSYDSFLKNDYQLLQQHCKKNNLLQNKIASFVKNPSVQQTVSPNIKPVTIGGYVQSKMVSGFAKLIKTFMISAYIR